MSNPVFVFLGGSTPEYFDLTVAAIKALKKNIPTATVGVIVPAGTGDLTSAVTDKLTSLDANLDVSNIRCVQGKKYFDNWNNTQYILDVQSFAAEFDPVIFLDSDTVLVKSLLPFVEIFVKSGKQFGFLSDFVNDHKNFQDKWDAGKPFFVPQTTIIFLRSASIPEFVKVWQENWTSWVVPAPFVNIRDPAPYYKYSRVSIQQYSLGQSIYKFVQNFDGEVNVISRSDLKLCRNFGIDSQKAKLKFLSAGCTFSNEGAIKVTINLQSGKVYKEQDIGGNKGDPFVTLKVGEWEKRSRTIKNTQEPVWNEEFVFSESSYWEANNITLTLWDYDGITKNDEIGSAKLSLLEYKTNTTPAPKHLTVPVFDKSGKETGLLEIGAEFYVEVLPDGDEGAVKSRGLKTESEADTDAVELYQGEKNVVLTIQSGKIYESHDVIGKDDGFVKVKIGGVEKKTKTVNGTQEPVWNEELTFEGVKSDAANTVTVSLWDEDTLTKNDLIGSGTVSLLKLVKAKDSKGHLSVVLTDEKGKKQAVVEIDAALVDPAVDPEFGDLLGKIAALAPPDEEEEAAPAERELPAAAAAAAPAKNAGLPYMGEKKAVLTIQSAKIYNKHDVMGKDDPFAIVNIGGVEKRTKTLDNTQEPVWDEVLEFDDVKSDAADAVTLTLYDEDSVTKNDLIGTAVFSLLAFQESKGHLSVPVFDKKGKEQGVVEIDAELEEPFLGNQDLLQAIAALAEQQEEAEAEAEAEAEGEV